MSESPFKNRPSVLGEIIQRLTPAIDRQRAGEIASQLADVLGGTLEQREQMIINQGVYPFHVILPYKPFRSSLSVSDEVLSFSARHERDLKAMPRRKAFCVSLKTPQDYMYATVFLPKVSSSLGIEVYSQPWTKEKDVLDGLLSENVQPLLAQVNYDPLREFFLNPIQMNVISNMQPVEEWARQVHLFHAIVSALFATLRKVKKKKAK